MTKYREKDAARDTNATLREVRAAHHAARDDAGDVRTGGTGDRPTTQNRADAAALERRVRERAQEGARPRDARPWERSR